MTLINSVPFAKILVPFTIGILLVNINENIGVYSNYALFAILAIFAFSYYFKNLFHHQIFGILSCLAFVLFGIFFTFNKNPHNQSYNLKKAGTKGNYILRVNEIPQEKSQSVKFISEVLYKTVNNTIIRVNEKVVCYLKKNGKTLKPGDIISVECDFREINKPENLFQFNYKKFLERQGIYYMTFINDKNNFINYHGNNANFIEKISYSGVVFLKNIFEKNIKDTLSRSVTESLIFGYKEDLPKNLIESYSKTGTLHVLAVSGMHVALVFFLLSKIFWFLNFRKYGKYLKSVIIILAVWIYCIITGLSPSVIRAGVMISLMITGKMLNRNINIYNIIFATAFIILLINPNWLFNVGFQLSFAAVLGIVFLQQYLKELWQPENKFLNLIWEIIVISVSAQIAAFPLCLLYFNQFPNYFILSNLVIIPLTTLIIYVGTLLVVFYKIKFISSILSGIVSFLVSITNKCVIEIEKIPYSFIDGVKVTAFQTLLIYLIIVFLIFWLIKNEKKAFACMLLCIVIFFSTQFYDKLTLQKEKTVVIFDIPGYNAILLSDGKHSIIISDKAQKDNLMFYIRGYLIEKRIYPLTKYFSIEGFEKIKYKNEELKLVIDNSKIYFRNYRIKICENSLPENTCNLSYIIPNNEILKYNLCEMKGENFILGHTKDKWLQKMSEKILSKCQNSAIKTIKTIKFNKLDIQ